MYKKKYIYFIVDVEFLGLFLLGVVNSWWYVFVLCCVLKFWFWLNFEWLVCLYKVLYVLYLVFKFDFLGILVVLIDNCWWFLGVW